MKTKRPRIKKRQTSRKTTKQLICIDCQLHSSKTAMSNAHPEYCIHYTPEYWVQQGFGRDWGDAAIMNWPHLEILRRKTVDGCVFLILAPHVQRRPIELYSSDPQAWGTY